MVIEHIQGHSAFTDAVANACSPPLQVTLQYKRSTFKMKFCSLVDITHIHCGYMQGVVVCAVLLCSPAGVASDQCTDGSCSVSVLHCSCNDNPSSEQLVHAC